MSPTRSTTTTSTTANSRSTSSSTSTSNSGSSPSSAARQSRVPGRVAFVGAGPGDSGLMTVRSLEFLAAADVVVIDQVAREDVVRRYCREGVEVIDAGHGDHGQPLTHAMRAKLVVKAA